MLRRSVEGTRRGERKPAPKRDLFMCEAFATVETTANERLTSMRLLELSLERMNQPVVDEDAGTHIVATILALVLDQELDVNIVFAIEIEAELIFRLAGVS